MNKIAIINYNLGNIYSIIRIFYKIEPKIEIKVTNSPKIIRSSDRIILPGQGSMNECINYLKKKNIYEEIIHSISNKPTLGICVGKQILFNYSQEGFINGLNKISGKISVFKNKKIPHIGWTKIKQKINHPLWKNISKFEYFYFIHSFYSLTYKVKNIAAESFYKNKKFICAVSNENIFLVQFHPEKSGLPGLNIYKNFISWKP